MVPGNPFKGFKVCDTLGKIANVCPSAALFFGVGWMGLLCADFQSFPDILKQSFPMYHCHNQNTHGFNPIH